MQEWGRWTRKPQVDTRLVSITCENGSENFRLSFDDPEAVGHKLEELNAIGEVIQEGELEFTFDLRIHPAEIGLRRRKARAL